MATWRDVRRIVLALPRVSERQSYGGNAAWSVNHRLFAWERPLRPSDLAALGDDAPTGSILGLRTADLEIKEALLTSNRRVYFTTPHFDGYPAVLIRLGTISSKELKAVIEEAWLSRAAKRAAASFLKNKGLVDRAPRVLGRS